MKPFVDRSQFRNDLSIISSPTGSFVPAKIGYGVEIRFGREINKRKNLFFISSGRWAEMPDDGLIDQEVPPISYGQLIDTLVFSAYRDQDERKTADQILVAGEVLRADTIDFDPMTSNDGRITVFEIRSRGYIANEEIPQKSRGIKVTNYAIPGFSTGISKNAFLDGGSSALGITREGFYGKKQEVIDSFEETNLENGLGFLIDSGDYNSENQTGAFGMTLYSAEFGTDSIAFAGLLK